MIEVLHTLKYVFYAAGTAALVVFAWSAAEYVLDGRPIGTLEEEQEIVRAQCRPWLSATARGLLLGFLVEQCEAIWRNLP